MRHAVWAGQPHIRKLVHHALSAMQVGGGALLRVGVALVWPRPLALPPQQGLPAPRRHHLKGDDGGKLLTAHWHIHGRQQPRPRVPLGQPRVGGAKLVGQDAEHVRTAVPMFGESHPTLRLWGLVLLC